MLYLSPSCMCKHFFSCETSGESGQVMKQVQILDLVRHNEREDDFQVLLSPKDKVLQLLVIKGATTRMRSSTSANGWNPNGSPRLKSAKSDIT